MPNGFNKGRSSKFREGSRVRQTPEEGRRTYRAKRCGNNNKDASDAFSFLHKFIILLVNISRPHIAKMTLQNLTDLVYETLPQVPYYPDFSTP